MSSRPVELVVNRPLSPVVNLLRFRLTDGKPWTHLPGQWVNLSLPGDGEGERRAYSIASIAEGDGFDLAVTRVPDGALSPKLHAMGPGDPALVDGPHGFFTRDDERAPSLFVAAGSGLAPIRAQLQAAFASGPADVPLTLLFGCRTPEDILFRDELEAWTAHHPNFQVRVTLSRAGASWEGLRGYVQDHVAQVVAERTVEHVYICGLSDMVRAVRATLKPLGLGRGLVHTERYD